MPFEITFSEIPAGYAVTSAREGQKVEVMCREFVSSEDGDRFIQRLEGLPTTIISKLPQKLRTLSSSIAKMLVVIRKDKTGTVYIDGEFKEIVVIVSKRKIEAGADVMLDDIADVHSLRFDGIDIPPDVGILYIFSAGWRKALFYDLLPIQPKCGSPRDYDIGIQLGHLHAYLLFQDFLKISGDTWEEFFRQEWFPFISLSVELRRKMVGHAQSKWEIDDLLLDIEREVIARLDFCRKKWANNPVFHDHIAVINTAVDRFLALDYVSTVSNLYPRIEGIMRTYHLASRPSIPATSSNLAETASSVNRKDARKKILLIPEKFHSYLKSVYFASFDPKNPLGISRHTVAHGVAPQASFSKKACLLGLLILDQLSYHFIE